MDENHEVVLMQAQAPAELNQQLMAKLKNADKRIIYTIIIGMIILIIVALGAFYLGAQSTKEPSLFSQELTQIPIMTPTPTAVPSRKSSGETPQTVVKNYYDWYVACINNHFNSNSKNSPQQDCPYNKLGLLTDALTAELQKPVDADLVLCAQNVPDSMKYTKTIIAGSYAAEIVQTVWKNSPTKNITVGLDKVNDTWKISSITCIHQ